MAGVEAKIIVPTTEEKTTTEPTMTQSDDSAAAVEVEIKGEEVPKVEKETEKTDEASLETSATVEEKDVKSTEEASVEEEKPAVEGKTVK